MVLGDCPGFEMRLPSFFSDGNAGLCFGNNHLGLPRECQAKAFQPVRLHELTETEPAPACDRSTGTRPFQKA